jgi:hypothetical protein
VIEAEAPAAAEAAEAEPEAAEALEASPETEGDATPEA